MSTSPLEDRSVKTARAPCRSTGDLAANDPEAYDRLQEDWEGCPAPAPLTEEDIDRMAEHYGRKARPEPEGLALEVVLVMVELAYVRLERLTERHAGCTCHLCEAAGAVTDAAWHLRKEREGGAQ